ncbi:hypothetical protein Tco_0934830, partial [Tanacetum coccineum]
IEVAKWELEGLDEMLQTTSAARRCIIMASMTQPRAEMSSLPHLKEFLDVL